MYYSSVPTATAGDAIGHPGFSAADAEGSGP